MKVEIKKFGEILTSRPAGREAGLAMRAYLKPKARERIELDFSDVLAVGPSWLDEVLSILREKFGKERVVCLPKGNPSVEQSLRVIEEQHDS